MKDLPVVDALLTIFRGGVWGKDYNESILKVLLKKGHCDEYNGYYFIKKSGVELLAEIGAIQV